MSWEDEALELFVSGKTKTEIAQLLQPKYFSELTVENVRRHKITPHINSLQDYTERDTKESYKDVSSLEYKADGSIVSQKFIYLKNGEDLTPQKILEAHGLKPSLWQIVSYKNNYWNTQVKDGEKQISYQSKLTAKPIEQEFSLDDIDNYFNNKDFDIDKPPTKAFNYDSNGEILEICIPDLHAGLLSWRLETGEDYDLKIVKDNFFKCINDIVQRCENKKLKKIIFVTLGDILHTDNDNQTTTKGTFQQVDGRFSKIFDSTLDMLIDGITLLGDIAPVEVVYVSGNHDRVAGYALLKATEKAFRLDNNITFDTLPNPRKTMLFGRILIGWAHGDVSKKRIANWLPQEAREEYGKSKFAEVHTGHIHSQQTLEEGGVIVRYLPTIASSSYWEHKEAFGKSVKSVCCFVWNETSGLREMWFNNI